MRGVGAKARRAVSGMLVAAALVVASLLATPIAAHAWQNWYAVYTTYGGYNHRSGPGTGYAIYGVVPMYSTVWSTGEMASGSGYTWLKVYWNGRWGWCVHKMPGYSDSFVFKGVTNTPVTTNVLPANGSSSTPRRPAIRWNYVDDNGGAADAAEIQISRDGGFTALARNGGTTLGAYNPDWDMEPGQYWWRARTHSRINGWGAWSGAFTFIIRHPTDTAASASSLTPARGTPVTVTFTVTKSLSGVSKGSAGAMPITVQQSSDGSSWSTAVTGSTDSSGVFKYTAALSELTHLRAVIGDTAWNAGSTSKAVVMSPGYAATTTKATVADSRPTYGKETAVVFTVSLPNQQGSAPGATPLAIQRSSDSKNWRTVANVVTDQAGSFTYVVKPTVSTFYRALAAHTAKNAGSESAAVRVLPRVYLGKPRIKGTAKYYGYPSIARDKYYRAWTYLKPRHTPGVYAGKLHIQYWSNSKESWVTYKKVGAKASDYSSYSKVSARFKATKGKRWWRIRFIHAADAYNAARNSSWYRVYVR